MVKEFLLTKRRCGHTDYMLRAALHDPKVTIVASSHNNADELARRYRNLVIDQPWYIRLWWKWTDRREPNFVSIYTARIRMGGICEPVMFDNSTLIK
jgi:hypothetical protein